MKIIVQITMWHCMCVYYDKTCGTYCACVQHKN